MFNHLWSFPNTNTKTSSVGLSQLVLLKRLKSARVSMYVSQTQRAFTSCSHSRLQCFWFTSQCCRPWLLWQREISEYLRYEFNICMLRLKALWNLNQFSYWGKCQAAGCLVRHSSWNQKSISHCVVRTPDNSSKSAGCCSTFQGHLANV